MSLSLSKRQNWLAHVASDRSDYNYLGHRNLPPIVLKYYKMISYQINSNI